MNTPANSIRREIRSLREKHSYFLMSAAGASVGFSITQMNNLEASPNNILLVIALTLWGISFFAGHRFVMRDEGALWANHTYLEALETREGQLVGRPALRDMLDDVIKPVGSAAERWRSMQIIGLSLGAISFV